MSPSNKPSILLLSAYDAASHEHWRRWLEARFTQFRWVTLALPDRHFYWRIRSNALTYLGEHKKTLSEKFDLIVATSMVDLVSLRGLLPVLAGVPAIVYFHENQFAYPVSPDNPHKSNIVNAQLNSVFTALCADKLIFNSSYNLETFFCGAASLFKRMPDGVNPQLIEHCRASAQVLPVPIAAMQLNVERKTAGTVEIVWNHRWEYDKQPEVFFDAMVQLADAGYSFKLHVLGQSFRSIPACFETARVDLADYIESWGYQPRSDYYNILEKADIVVSTALHDFQGLSMLEAIHRHCIPIAPNRVAYPEYIPASLLYDPNKEVDSLSTLLSSLMKTRLPRAPDVSRYTDRQLASDYQKLLLETMNTSADYGMS